MEKDLQILAGSRLFSGVQPEQLPLLLQDLGQRTVEYDRGSFLLHAGDSVTSLGIVLSGRVLIIREDFWGRCSILASIDPGHCFAETFSCVPGACLGVSITADVPCRVMYLSLRRVLEPEKQASPLYAILARNLLSDIAAKNIAFTEKLTHLSKRTTREKLLSYLSSQAQKQGSVSFDIPFTRQQLADYLFVERSGLSSELCKMRDEGILTFQRNHFVLKTPV